MKEKEKAVLAKLESAVKSFDSKAATDAARETLEVGVDPLDAIDKGLTKGLKEVGELFEKGDLFVLHLIHATEATKSALEVLEPELLDRKMERKLLGRVVLGTVTGDIHDIGKNLVSSMLTANGFKVYDVGKDAPVEAFIEKAKEVGADVIGASALLTTTMPAQKDLADAIVRSGLNVKYIIGGAVTSEAWAKEIGAAYAEDASSAVHVIKDLMSIEA